MKKAKKKAIKKKGIQKKVKVPLKVFGTERDMAVIGAYNEKANKWNCEVITGDKIEKVEGEVFRFFKGKLKRMRAHSPVFSRG